MGKTLQSAKISLPPLRGEGRGGDGVPVVSFCLLTAYPIHIQPPRQRESNITYGMRSRPSLFTLHSSLFTLHHPALRFTGFGLARDAATTSGAALRRFSIAFQSQSMPSPGSAEGSAYPSFRTIRERVMWSNCGMCSSQ